MRRLFRSWILFQYCWRVDPKTTGFILSYNNCPTIKEYYKEYQQFFPRWQYTMGQGETRIGKYRKERGTNNYVKESHEIIIYSPPKKQ